MKNTLLTLIKLTEIDKKIDQIQHDRETTPQLIQELKTEITQLLLEITTLENEISTLSQTKNDGGDFIREKKEWIDKREQILKSLQTNKEYQAALKEIATAKKQISDKEAQAQDFTPKIEELSAKLAALQESNQTKISDLQIQIGQKEECLQKIDDVLQEETNKRKAILVEIQNDNTIKHYEYVRKKVTPAMAKAENGVCSECGSRIPPQILNLLHKSQSMQYCYRCKRIIYLEELLTH